MARVHSAASLLDDGLSDAGGAEAAEPEDLTADKHVLTRTVTRLEDIPAGETPAVGTVLEEEAPKPVQLMIEFIGTGGNSESIRQYVDALYTQPMEISIECQFLPKTDIFSNSDPFCVVLMRENERSPWAELGRTETLVNTHFPRFVKKFVFPCNPERDMDRELLVKVYGKGGMKKQVHMAQGQCTLWDIVIAAGQCKVVKLDSINRHKDSWLILSGDVVRPLGAERPVNVYVRYDRSAKPKAKTFFVLNRGLKKARWTPVYRSEPLRAGGQDFKPARVSSAELFAGDDAKHMRLEVYQHRPSVDPKLMGFVQLSIKQLTTMEEGRVLHWFCGQEGRAPGLVLLAKREVSDEEVSVWILITNDAV